MSAELDAVNRMLRLSSFQTVNEIAEGDQRSNIALNTLTRQRKDKLSKPLDFNELLLNLPTDATGKVPIPETYLAVTLPDETHSVRLNTDDNKLYVWDIKNDQWHDQRIDKVEVRHDVPFDKIPQVIQQWIVWEAVAEFYAEHRGEPTAFIKKSRNDQKSVAMNSLPPKTIHAATGFNLVKAFYVGT